MTDDELELPDGYTWDDLRAEADRINAWRAKILEARPDDPLVSTTDDVTPEHLARCRREEQAFEAREAAKWDALSPVEQAAMTTLEGVADAEITEACEIITAATRRRPGVVTGSQLMKALRPADPDFGQVTAAMQRLTAVTDMLGWEDE